MCPHAFRFREGGLGVDYSVVLPKLSQDRREGTLGAQTAGFQRLPKAVEAFVSGHAAQV